MRSYTPDIAIVDVRMPPGNADDGLVAAAEIRRTYPSVAVLVLSQHLEPTYMLELVGDDASGVGYLLKDRVRDVAEFVDAVERVAGGGTAFDPEVVKSLVGGHRRSALDELTDRERDVLSLIAEGRSNRAIGKELFLSSRAVERHVQGDLPEARPARHRGRQPPRPRRARAARPLAALGNRREPTALGRAAPSLRRRAATRGCGSSPMREGDPKMSLDLEALETSFDLVAPRGDELMDVFYARLFAAAPGGAARSSPTTCKRQKTMLLGALVLLRKSLRNLDAIVPKLRELGARHVAYGAQPEHYPVVGAVLIASMAAVAGDAWKPEYEAAWGAAFEIVAGAMIEGAAAVELGAAA